MKGNRRPNKEPPQKDNKEKQPDLVKPNSFAILQVEEDEEDQLMENTKDKGLDCSESGERNLAKRKAPSEMPKKDKEIDEPTKQMETNQETNREDLSQEEEVLENLLHEWKNLDETFIPKEQKKLYTKTFQQYKNKLEKGKASTEEFQETWKESRSDKDGQINGGRKEEEETSMTPSNSWEKC